MTYVRKFKLTDRKQGVRQSSLTEITASVGGGAILSGSMTYDAASRLSSVSQGGLKAAYAYTSPLQTVGSVTFSNAGTTMLTTSNSWDNLRRLASVSSVSGTTTVSSHAYTLNALNQRTAATRQDGTQWSYGYDAAGEVTSASKATTSGTLVPGGQFAYSFDGIGNRTKALEGGDINGANLREWDYTSNTLNQYTQRTVPGTVDVTGSGTPSATVTVQAQGIVNPVSRKGGFFQKGLTYSNTGSAIFDTATVYGVLPGSGSGGGDIASEVQRPIVIPKTPQIYTYDADGNLLNDGLWTYTWDGENRMLSMTSDTNVPASNRQQLVFSYDSDGRRVSKTVSNWNTSTSSYVPQTSKVFIWNGWLLQAEISGTSATSGTTSKTFVWGNDLSNSMQGAGGVGGLLWINDFASSQSHFTAYDGNGNVTGLVSASTGTVTARYDYGPFGEVLEASGPYAAANPIRFSTKYEDSETGLDDYGHRYYQPGTGRWLSRDPIEENGGENLYGFLNNSPLNKFDSLGLEQYGIWASAYIPVKSFVFPYGDNPLATWSGDGRTSPQVFGAARAYNFIVIDTDPSVSSPVLVNSSGGGTTTVTTYLGRTISAADTAPPIATITRSGNNHITDVQFTAQTHDPLVSYAPSLYYQYHLIFDTCKGTLKINGSVKQFPAYDLIFNNSIKVNHQPAVDNPLALYLPSTTLPEMSSAIKTYP